METSWVISLKTSGNSPTRTANRPPIDSSFSERSSKLDFFRFSERGHSEIDIGKSSFLAQEL
jgi:hypothetical protein